MIGLIMVSLRYFLGVCRFCPTLALYGDTGWLPCTFRRWGNMLRFWNRLIKMEDTRLTKQVFHHDYRLGTNNWCSEVKDIMGCLNLSDSYNDKTTVNLADAWNRLRTHYGTIWSRDIQTRPKLRTYVTFKHEFKCEDYVSMDLKKYERSILTQFRCGILPIRIETGRYVGGAPDQRLCFFCDQRAVEDERYMLLCCDKYNGLRDGLLGDVLAIAGPLPADDKLKLLVTCHVRKTAKFLTKAYLLRRSYLYAR